MNASCAIIPPIIPTIRMLIALSVHPELFQNATLVNENLKSNAID